MQLNIILRWVYTLIFILGIPVLLLRLLWKSRGNPAYRRHWAERFGFFKAPAKTGGLWVHAVSVGETMAAVPLIREFQKRFPDLPIVITSTTPTGRACAKSIFKDEVFQVYFPYDLSSCIQRFLKNLQPKLLVVMEKELWLNCFSICRQQLVPIYIVNASLSRHSLKGYQRFKTLIRGLLECMTMVFAQSETDADRFLELGVEQKHLMITGNMKFDIAIQEALETAGKQYRAGFSNRPVWIAASTHIGEEEQILVAFRQVLEQVNNALLILVPRHPERFGSVATLIEQQGYTAVKRTSGLPVTENTQVLLGDTMGELTFFYALSDVAFVGGSLVAVGGHNTLEPAALGVPVIVGPHVHNCMDITKLLLEAGGLLQVSDSDGLAHAVLRWFSAPDKRQVAGEAAKSVVEKNRGAVKKIVDFISFDDRLTKY
jgi:3-deoxy-D-manno-octulosonic-acid transferase